MNRTRLAAIAFALLALSTTTARAEMPADPGGGGDPVVATAFKALVAAIQQGCDAGNAGDCDLKKVTLKLDSVAGAVDGALQPVGAVAAPKPAAAAAAKPDLADAGGAEQDKGKTQPPAPPVPPTSGDNHPKVTFSRADTAERISSQVASPGSIAPLDTGTVTTHFSADSSTDTAKADFTVNAGSLWGGAQLLTLEMKSPVAQSQNYQNLASLDGLTAGASVGLTWTYIGHPNLVAVAHEVAGENAKADCSSAFALMRSDDEVRAAWTKYVSDWGVNPGMCVSDIQKFLGNPANGFPQERVILKAKISKSLEAAQKEQKVFLQDQSRYGLSAFPIFSVNAKIANVKHSYYDSATLKSESPYLHPYQVGFSGGIVFDSGQMSLIAGYNYQRAYNDGGGSSQKVLCQNSKTAGAAPNCVYGYIDAPTMKSDHLLDVEYRLIFGIGKADSPFLIGLDPSFTYDVKTHEQAAALPIYVYPGASKFLTGGPRIDWTRKLDPANPGAFKDTLTVGVFVTAAFCIIPGETGCGGGSKK